MHGGSNPPGTSSQKSSTIVGDFFIYISCAKIEKQAGRTLHQVFGTPFIWDVYGMSTMSEVEEFEDEFFEKVVLVA